MTAMAVLASRFDASVAVRSALRAMWELASGRAGAPRVVVVLATDPDDTALVFHAEFLCSAARVLTRQFRTPLADLHWPYHVRGEGDDPARRVEIAELVASHPDVDLLVVETEWPSGAPLPTSVARLEAGGSERLVFVARGIGPRIEPVPEVEPLDLLTYLGGPVLPPPALRASPATARVRLTRMQRDWLADPVHADWHPVTPKTRATVTSLERRGLVETTTMVCDAVATLHCRSVRHPVPEES